MRYAALLLLLCACNSLSIEQRNELAQIQERAKNYFDRGLIAQAIGQIDRGLELAPEDYQLNTLKGTILLRQSSSALGQDHRLLDEATALLEKVFETRAANRHEPYLLFNYALAQEKQGRRNLGESISLRDQATRAPEKAPLLEKAEAATAAANAYFAGAREHLATLIERGELLRLSHQHLLLIAQDLREDAAFDDHQKAYLAQLGKDQAFVKAEIERTPIPGYEQKRLQDLEDLKAEELEMRTLIAEHYYLTRDYKLALDMLDRVLALDPRRSVDYYNRGRVLLELDRAEDAAKDFRSFLSISDLPDDNPKKAFAYSKLLK
ncbi:MAG: hypothetical protein KA020_17225 [Planctomycetes bacterium]|nr:hypothetical protein [Planctomycetota bacterium]MCC7063200.1 hypothetical protein [Planctomycetota bacterium]